MSFQNIENTIYSDFYINEVWSVASSIIALKQKLFVSKIVQDTTEKTDNNILSKSTEPHEIISSILNHSSRLHKLFHSSSQRDGESDESFNFRKERSKFLRKLLLTRKRAGHEIFKSGVRNSIEHLDERLDLMNSKILSNDVMLNQKAILCNMSLSSKKLFVNWDEVFPLKVFVVDEMQYYMTDHEFNTQSIDLEEVFEEVDKIYNNCASWAERKSDEEGQIINKPVGILKTPKHTLL